MVGITNPDPGLTRQDAADSSRSAPAANPLTYYERYCMVNAVLAENGLGSESFSVVPFPVNFPELYKYYVPLEAVFSLTIYDAWGEKELQMLQTMGLKTELLWRRRPEEKGLSSTAIRQKIAAGEPWKHLVPAATARLSDKFAIAARR